jgi:hypothetical protein
MYSKVYTCNVDSNKCVVMMKERLYAMNYIVQEPYVISMKRKKNETQEF